MNRKITGVIVLFGIAVFMSTLFFLRPVVRDAGRQQPKKIAPEPVLVFGGQPELPKTEISFSGEVFLAEVAATDESRAAGLSGRSTLPSGHAMLFSFSIDSPAGFWMKDMLFPIDMVWFNADQKVVHIVENADPSSYPAVFYPPVPARFVLELPAGTVSRLLAGVGSVFRTADGKE